MGVSTVIPTEVGGGDYSTLATWVAAVSGSGVAETASVHGGGNVGAVSITSGTFTPTIEAAAGHQHDGTGWNTAYAHVDGVDTWPIYCTIAGFQLRGMQLRAPAGYSAVIIGSGSGDLIESNYCLSAGGGGTTHNGIYANLAAGTITFRNNAIHWANTSTDNGLYVEVTGGTPTFLAYNNSIYTSHGYGLTVNRSGGSMTVTIRNNAVFAPTCFRNIVSGSINEVNCSNNCASDTTAASAFASTSDQASKTASNQFVNLAGNMRVKAGADLIGNGVDLSGAGVTTDFEGGTRSGTPTIGWDEYLSPATVPSAPTFVSVAAVSASQIDLAWSIPSSDGGAAITGYRIQRRSPSGSGDWTTIVSDTESTDTSASDTGLSASTNYGYRFAAINSVGVGAYSIEVSDTTEAAPEPESAATNWTTQSGMAAGLGFD